MSNENKEIDKQISLSPLSLEERVSYLEGDSSSYSERIEQLEYSINEILDEIYQLKLRVRRLEER